MALTMKLTEQQQKDVDRLVEQLKMINEYKSFSGKVFDIGTIKKDVQAKVDRAKEVKLINENWMLAMNQTIASESEILREDMEALGLAIHVSNRCISIKPRTGSDRSMPIYYEFNESFDDLSKNHIITGVYRKVYVSGNTSYVFKSLKELAADDRVINKIKQLHEAQVK